MHDWVPRCVNSLIRTRKKGGKGFTSPPLTILPVHSSPYLSNKRDAPFPRLPFQPLVDSFDSKGGDYGKPNNGDSDDSADGDKGQHGNASDMAIHADDSDIDDWSVPDSHTTDAKSVDLLNSD